MDEGEAITLLRQGDIDGLAVLVARYQTGATRVAQLITRDRALAEDVVRAAFVHAYERIDELDEGRSFAPWFLGMVGRDAARAAQRAARQARPAGDAAEDGRDGAPSTLEELLARLAEVDPLTAGLARLSPAERAAVVLRSYAGLTDGEGAERAGSPAGTGHPGTGRWWAPRAVLARLPSGRGVMRERRLRRELRRLARREVPAGEPNLWPEIRWRLAPRRDITARPGRARDGSSRSDLDSTYVWRADARRGPLAPGGRALAAVVALVVVGGVLAALVRGHAGSQGPPRPAGTPAVRLPLTVTAGGIPITLESLTATGSSTRFTFSVELPTYAAEVAGGPVVLPLKLSDVSVDGLEGGGLVPVVTESPHPVGQPTVRLTVTYDAGVAPGQPVTFTVLELALATPANVTLPPGITTEQGPWTFTIPAGALRTGRTPATPATGAVADDLHQRRGRSTGTA